MPARNIEDKTKVNFEEKTKDNINIEHKSEVDINIEVNWSPGI